MIYPIMYGLIFAVVGVGVYVALCSRDNRKRSKRLIAEKEKYDELVADVKLLKKTYQSGDLTEQQREDVKALYANAASDLKKQAAVVTSLNQEF
mgnify:CR=1 FL=1